MQTNTNLRADYIARLVASAPELTPEQLVLLRIQLDPRAP